MSVMPMCKYNTSYFLEKHFSTGVHPILPNVHVQFPSDEANANYCTFLYFPTITPLRSHHCHLKSCSRQQISDGFGISQLGAAKSCSICFLIKTWWFFYSNCLIIAEAISSMSILIRLLSALGLQQGCGWARAICARVHMLYFPRAGW